MQNPEELEYTMTVWENNSLPAINAENLNHIEQGIFNVTELLKTTITYIDTNIYSKEHIDSCFTEIDIEEQEDD